MARLDSSRPPLVPKMVRLDPLDWERLERRADRMGTTPSELLRGLVTDGLNWLDENSPMPDD